MVHRHTDPFLAQPPDKILAALDGPGASEDDLDLLRAQVNAYRRAVQRGWAASPPEAFRVRRRGPGRIRVDEVAAFVRYRRARNDARDVVAAWRERLPREARGRQRRSRDATALKARRAASGPLRDALRVTFPDMADELRARLVESVIESGPGREVGADIRVDVLREYVGKQLGVSKSTIRDTVATAGARDRQWVRFLRWVAAEHPERLGELRATASALEQWRGQWPGKVPTDFYELCGPEVLYLARPPRSTLAEAGMIAARTVRTTAGRRALERDP